MSDISKVRKALATAAATNAGMTRFLDHMFGVGNYLYDPNEDVWVTPDKDYEGPDRGFIVIPRGGSWFKAVVPAAALS